MIVAIAAHADNMTMGYKGAIPWAGDMPADVRRFRDITLGHTIIMGQKTFDEFEEPLPDRLSVVVTFDKHEDTENVKYVNSIDEALAYDKEGEEVFIIGGASILNQTKNYWQKLYLTEVHENFHGDAFFPEVDLSGWRKTNVISKNPDSENKYSYTFIDYER